MVKVREITEVKEDELRSLNNLLPQLSKSAKPLNSDQFSTIVNSDSTRLYFAEEDGVILGTLSLVIFPIPTGLKCWLEDVVVDLDARGRGIGKLLILFALEEAQRMHAQTVNLTSRPNRETANKLYQSVGFETRQTNVYRFKNSYAF